MFVGKKIGPYIVDKELGSGAMGSVYRARSEEGERVAIKVVAPGLVANDTARKRFKRETDILKQLDHPNIVRLIASGTVHNTPFYVMEFVEGESLDHVMERRGRITWEELIPLGQQLCAALQHAHDLGIIHRDLKPGNLMVLPDGTLKLADFGIAKDIDVTALTAANSTVGTCAYMSPEQCRGSLDISPKADLYSMGVVFFEMLTGRKPFLADTVMEMFMQHTQGNFPRPSRLVMDIPVWLDTLICQLLEKKPEDRPYNADKVAEALADVKSKALAQQSAAMTAVRRRRADKTKGDVALDAKERELGRTMLGKAKKKKREPFYRKTWFTAAGIGGILLAMALVIYYVAIKPPSPEFLLVEMETIMGKKDIEAWRRARENDGPIAVFLRHYPGHPLADKMRKWRDEIDLADTELQMMNRRNLPIDSDRVDARQEEEARLALKDEDNGKLTEAARRWEVLKHENEDSANDNLRRWALVARKHGQTIEAVHELHQRLKSKVDRDRAGKDDKAEKGKAEKGVEKQALDALHCEADATCSNAIYQWSEIMKDTEGKEDMRRWYLLAAMCKRNLEQKGKTLTK